MHLLVRERHGLDDGAAVDLGHAPADIVLLSFADSDLASAAAAWLATCQVGRQAGRPSLRLVSLSRLVHPMSVDLYAEQVVARSRVVILRLLGGLDYFSYGAEVFGDTCRRHGVPLAVLPGDKRRDARLDTLSTIAPPLLARLDAYLSESGPENCAAALRLASHLAGLAPDDAPPPVAVPSCGEHAFDAGDEVDGAPPDAVVVLYRSHWLAGDLAPMAAMAVS